MNDRFCLLLMVIVLIACGAATAQVTSLIINGSTTTFTMVSGDTISWSYDVPPGSIVNGQIWIDLNGNSTIDSAIDKPLFLFTQTDGDTTGYGGPPDIDGLANGHVIFKQNVGLAPASYILKFTHAGVSQSMVGTVTPLLAPTKLITGRVTPPVGKAAANILVEARIDNQANGEMFWDGLTDAGGLYTIALHADSAQTYSQWRVSVQDNFSPYIPVPQETVLTLAGSTSNINFHYLAPAARVSGLVVDENDHALVSTSVGISSQSDTTRRYVNTDIAGHFEIGLLASELNGQSWNLETSQQSNYTTTVLRARSVITVINPGDSLIRNLKVYSVNSSIKGVVRINGAPPNFPMWIVADSPDTAQASTFSDSITGSFIIPVSDKIAHYQLMAYNTPFGWMYNPLTASAGDSGVVLNFFTTSVQERASGIPGEFALHQNYPNPFNPTTAITYDVPERSHVSLSIFNVLGEEVARPVDADQSPGKYSVMIDGSGLPSGIYFYRLHAGANSAFHKMVLLK